MSGFNARQVAQLLKPISPKRVLADGKGHSHVSQQDVTAHLIRVFGFGNFDLEVLSVEPVYETPRTEGAGETLKLTGRWDVCYRAVVRLTIRNEHGDTVCRFEDGSTATAQNQSQGDAHDLAMKSAISLAKKRCAINLGDQFGLSLYNKGQTNALVLGTLIEPGRRLDELGKEDTDMQADVPAQLTLGDEQPAPEAGSDAA